MVRMPAALDQLLERLGQVGAQSGPAGRNKHRSDGGRGAAGAACNGRSDAGRRGFRADPWHGWRAMTDKCQLQPVPNGNESTIP